MCRCEDTPSVTKLKLYKKKTKGRAVFHETVAMPKTYEALQDGSNKNHHSGLIFGITKYRHGRRFSTQAKPVKVLRKRSLTHTKLSPIWKGTKFHAFDTYTWAVLVRGILR